MTNTLKLLKLVLYKNPFYLKKQKKNKMAKHHPDLIFCRKQAGVGKKSSNRFIFTIQTFIYFNLFFKLLDVYVRNAMENV